MQTNRKRETGFTLIELLVAMSVTLLIAAATLGLFSYAMNVNASGSQIGNIDSNLRSAMNLVVRDLLQAGQGYPTGGIALPTGTGCQNINRPIYTATAQFPYGCANPTTYPNMPAVAPGSGLGPNIIQNPSLTWMPQPTTNPHNSDIITFIYQDNDLVTSVNPATLLPNYLVSITATQLTFSSTVPITGAAVSDPAAPNDLFLVYGGGTARLVEATAVSGQVVTINSADPLNLNQQSSAPSVTGTIYDLQALSGVTYGTTCTQPAPPTPPPASCAYTAQRVLMISYWLDDTTVINGQLVPRLMRQVGMNAPVSVAEVIEDLEFSYDYVNGTTPVNNVTSTAAAATACSCTITDNQIRKVNIFMAARSDTVLSATNQYLRDNMAIQVDLRSLAFVNRYQ
ncbi:MAG TPA: prepilin-type N-terminal cleavage/methylation domain-containing protein [Candidatus Acidoferrales bacterium]|nr:prepilin-type N-terminal cleavage/methylation domain-containing protein [Candidatus Acidoferrales bacterium]